MVQQRKCALCHIVYDSKKVNNAWHVSVDINMECVWEMLPF